MCRIVTWNINGLRAVSKKNGLKACVDALLPDILCLQEIRCDDKVAASELAQLSSTLPHVYWNCSTQPKGYSGTAILSREAPTRVVYGFEDCPPAFATEGRILTAYFSGFTIVCVYVPNSGSDRHPLRTQVWDVAFANYVSILNDAGPLIVCGDLNVAHKEIDIFHAQSNKNTAGFTPEERANFSSLLLIKAGLRDTFRELHPDKVSYSWWSYRMQARKRNVGWRIDYILTSSTIKAVACDIAVHIDGSDHAPVWMDIEEASRVEI